MGKRKGKRFTAEDAGVHHKKLCVTDKFIKLLHRMDMIYLGKLESGRSKGCRVRVIALESCVLLKIGANDGQQELKVCPDPRISVHFLCLTLQSRLQKSDFVSKIELQDENACGNGLGSIERYDTFSSMFAEFKRRYPHNQDIDICRKLEKYFEVSAKDVCDFWYHIHRREAEIRHDNQWLKGEKRIQEDQGGNVPTSEDKPAPGSGLKKEMIPVSEGAMRDYQKILETKPLYLEEEDAYLVTGITSIIGCNHYEKLKSKGLIRIISEEEVGGLKIEKEKIPRKTNRLAKYVLVKANVKFKYEESRPKSISTSQSRHGYSGTDSAAILELIRELEERFSKTEERLGSIEAVIAQRSTTDSSPSVVDRQVQLKAFFKDPRQAVIDAIPGLKEAVEAASRLNELFPEKK
jgi:hypothetical protein